MWSIDPSFFREYPELQDFFSDPNPTTEAAIQLKSEYMHLFERAGNYGCETVSPLMVAIHEDKLSHFKILLQVFIHRYRVLMAIDQASNANMYSITEHAKMAMTYAVHEGKDEYCRAMNENDAFRLLIRKQERDISTTDDDSLHNDQAGNRNSL